MNDTKKKYGSGETPLHCSICPNAMGKTDKELELTSCDGLYNKIDCFQGWLYDAGIIYVPNGSTRITISEAIYNILRKYSTNNVERGGNDLNIPKPCDVAIDLIQARLGGEKNGI
jgi:hypothetical protein